MQSGFKQFILRCSVAGAVTLLATSAGTLQAQNHPWQNAALPPAQRAEMVLHEMTLDEKIAMLHGEGMPGWKNMSPQILAVQDQINGGAGMVFGIERLGIPRIQMDDAAYGVRFSANNGRYSTALPSNVGSAASWDPEAACAYGTLIGKELRAQGYNMTLGGGTNLNRDPRNGRTFEYLGEDPVLAGTLAGQRIRCEGAQHVISDIKHYALNDQESGRQEIDVRISERAARESDLLAFQIGVATGHPNAVMCSYGAINGDYACESHWLLTDVLKKEWGFPGFVVSDWAATHSTEKASAAGLDNEEPLDEFFGPKLKAAVESGKVPMAQIDDHVRRILYAEFASGIIDDPPHKSVVDAQSGFDIARRVEEQSAVLLRNATRSGTPQLPLDSSKLRSVAVIGMHADTGMISGGGSAQVDPQGGSPTKWRAQVWFPTSPLEAIRAKAPGAHLSFCSGANIAEAVAQAKQAEVAVVFVWQWEAEDADLPNLSLPGNQDELVAAVAAANPHTIVVLETGTAVKMPWIDKTAAVLEAWYGGSKGADAVANSLFGAVDPSGKLPMTFPLSENDLPRTTIAQPPPPVVNGVLSFKVDYNIEGAAVGYKWFESQKKPVLFPFGFGLSYTSFKYSALTVSADGSTATFTLQNTGQRRGAEVAQVYATLPSSSGEPWKRLVGWKKIELDPNQTIELKVRLEPLALSVWDESVHKFVRPSGSYRVVVGGSSADTPLTGSFSVQ
jgi:beta-glucosidase